jgi:hypothetical protein
MVIAACGVTVTFRYIDIFNNILKSKNFASLEKIA